MQESRSQARGSDTQPIVTIAVSTYNRAETVIELLRSCEHLEFPREHFEILVVNDGSGDETAATLNAFARETAIDFRYVSQTNAGTSAGRNRAIALARGAFIAATDDDCEVDPQWLRELLASFTDDSIAAVSGSIIPRSSTLTDEYFTFHGVMASKPVNEYGPPCLITANACYRTAVLRDLGGFDERFQCGGEDIDISWRIAERGYRFRAAPKAVVYHHNHTFLPEFAKTFARYGYGHRLLLEKRRRHPGNASWSHDVNRGLSLRYGAYRAREYHFRQGLTWQQAVVFAYLDLVRNLAWAVGYWIVYEQRQKRSA